MNANDDLFAIVVRKILQGLHPAACTNVRKQRVWDTHEINLRAETIVMYMRVLFIGLALMET